MEREPDTWQTRLPAELLAQVMWPVRLEAHHDDSVPASKWRGYDLHGLLCYYRHRFSQWDSSLDAEGEPMAVLLRDEHFEAWRCHTGQWLRRVQRIAGDGREDGVMSDSGFSLVEAQAIPRL